MAITETVGVLRRTQAGEDAMGEPVWSWDMEEVAGVLVKCLDSEPVSAAANKALRPEGFIELYRLSFPKGYTAPLAHCKVVLTRHGEEAVYDVVGEKGETPQSPTPWMRDIDVRRCRG